MFPSHDRGGETPVAPNVDEARQMEAMARMMQNEPTAMLSVGTIPNEDNTVTGLQALQQSTSTPLGVLALAQKLAPKAPTLESFQRQYVDKPSAYEQYASVSQSRSASFNVSGSRAALNKVGLLPTICPNCANV